MKDEQHLITVKNVSDVKILVQISWGYSQIHAKEININQTEQFPVEIALYDIDIINAETGGQYLRQNHVGPIRGNIDCEFSGKGGQYKLGPHW